MSQGRSPKAGLLVVFLATKALLPVFPVSTVIPGIVAKEVPTVKLDPGLLIPTPILPLTKKVSAEEAVIADLALEAEVAKEADVAVVALPAEVAVSALPVKLPTNVGDVKVREDGL